MLVLAPLSQAVAVRRFGSDGADLDVDLDDAVRARAITRVLAACVRDGDDRPLGEERAWQAPIGTRLQALLAIVARGDARPFAIVHPCAGCGEPLELELGLDALLEFHRERAVSPSVPVELGGRALELRRPTGDDQRRWAASAADARQMLLDVVPADGRALVAAPGDDELARVEAAMAAADPLIDFHVATDCPACGAAQRIDVDLEGLALARLQREQRALVDEVHRLATAYLWRERDILALSPTRRALYLERLGP